MTRANIWRKGACTKLYVLSAPKTRPFCVGSLVENTIRKKRKENDVLLVGPFLQQQIYEMYAVKALRLYAGAV